MTIRVAVVAVIAITSSFGVSADFNPVVPPAFKASNSTGPFAPNTQLRKAVRYSKELQGPETVIFSPKGEMIGFMGDGTISKILPDGAEEALFVGGRPLSGAYDRDGNLYVCEPSKGLLFIPHNDTSSVTVVAARTEDGRPIRYINDIDIASNGKVYFSDASRHAPWLKPDGRLATMEASVKDALEGTTTGRLIEYDPSTRVARTLVSDLRFANGVALAHDESFVLVAETFRLRVVRYWLKGDKAGTQDVLLDRAPGMIDGISRGSKHFWMAVYAPAPTALTLLAPFPWLRSLVNKLPDFLKPKPAQFGMVAEFDAQGKYLRSFQDPIGNVVTSVTSVTEREGKLFLGGLYRDHVPVLDLTKL